MDFSCFECVLSVLLYFVITVDREGTCRGAWRTMERNESLYGSGLVVGIHRLPLVGMKWSDNEMRTRRVETHCARDVTQGKQNVGYKLIVRGYRHGRGA